MILFPFSFWFLVFHFYFLNFILPQQKTPPRAEFFLIYCLFLQLKMKPCFLAVGADLDPSSFGERGPLEIGVFSGFSRRVEFGGANTVGVFSSHEGSFIADWA
jgi:hypothetical protein